MVSSVNFGGLTTIGGKTVAAGISSGYDTEALINTLMEARSVPLDKLETRLTTLGDQVTKLGSLRNILSDLQSTADLLRNPPGVNNAANNIFEYRTAFITADDGNAGNTYLGVTVEPGAQTSNYEIQIVSLAQKQTNTALTQASKTADLVNGATTFEIRAGVAGTTVLATINLDDNDSLEDIATKVNSFVDATGVAAKIIQVSDTDFRLVFESTETGVENAFNLNFTADPGNLTAALGFTSVAATDANITLNGIQNITRSSNQINDIVEGITFSLFKLTPDPGGAGEVTVSVEITEDKELVSSAIHSFVESYNAFRTFAAEQTARGDGGAFTEDAILGSNLTLRTTLDRLSVEVNRIVDGITSGNLSNLSALGLTLADQAASGEGDDAVIAVSNILTINETILSTALDGNFAEVKKLFEFTLANTQGKLTSLSRTNDLTVTNFTVDVDISRDPHQIARVIYEDTNGDTQTINALYTPTTDRSVGNNITEADILGASVATQQFSHGSLADGDGFRVTITAPDLTTTNLDFIYRATPAAANEFNSLTTLKNVLNNAAGISSSIEDNKLVISADDDFDVLSFTNLNLVGVPDFVGAIGLNNTEIIGGVISDLRPSEIVTSEDVTTGIFGAATSVANFSSLTDGDSFTITIEDSLGVAADVEYEFIYKAAPVASNEFSTLTELRNAIEASVGLSASIVNNRLKIYSDDSLSTLEFSDEAGNNTLISEFGFSNTTIQPLLDSYVGGLELVYAGDGTDIINVTVTQGLGDRFYNTINQITEDDGLLDADLDSLSESEDSINADIERMQSQIDTYRETLLAKFSALEEAVSRVNSLLQFLSAEADARLVAAG